MALGVLKWKLIKLFNANTYFRENILNLKYIGNFFIRHHTTHLLWFEEVCFKSYDVKSKKYTVKKKINKHTIEVDKQHLHINAK